MDRKTHLLLFLVKFHFFPVFLHLGFVHLQLVFELGRRLFVDLGVCLVFFRGFFVELRLGTVGFRLVFMLISIAFVLLGLGLGIIEINVDFIMRVLQLLDGVLVRRHILLVHEGAVLAVC